MDLEEFNSLPAEQARSLLRPCLDVERWAEVVSAGRPYDDLDRCLEAARTGAHPLTSEEIEAAMAHHPRIGERAGGDSVEATHSRREQAGLGELGDTVRTRLAEGNIAYEQRFGRVFLIRAAGRSSEEILAELERRLENSAEQELAETGEQLEQIAALRLEGMLR
ncbi:MAG: 2-oxo-4-hydroxy-4-carboxy-5-ureidoimidazoline decarboxylase [Nesterenkonia sp.]|nr:2-oxo-4-hydroxy-4-carboxy-5-ureidoimidazoline decarboxylase [Nesterenkonia sp.]